MSGEGACRAEVPREVDVRIRYDDPSLVDDLEARAELGIPDRLARMAFYRGCDRGVGALRHAPADIGFRTLDYDAAVPAPPDNPDTPRAPARMITLSSPRTYVVIDDIIGASIIHDGRMLGSDLAPYAEFRLPDRIVLLQPTVSSDDIAFWIRDDE